MLQATKITADLYVEVLQFYGRQMPLLDARRIEEFSYTFTEDCVLEHLRAWRVEGRANMVEETKDNFPRYDGIVFRHWFDKVVVDPLDDGSLRVSYYAIVSLTHPDGSVTWEPSCTVNDLLVRVDGELKVRHREVATDNVPDVALYWTGQPAAQA